MAAGCRQAAPARRATRGPGVASLTATADRARFNQHARHARKDAR
ncbi:DUF6380 family protein [Streptomyces sp. NPDC046860]